jgi:hypothetical protein
MRQGERNDIKWTTETPTQEGIYFAKHQNGTQMTVKVISAKYNDESMAAVRFGVTFWVSLKDFTHWLGPLPAPEPPTESE